MRLKINKIFFLILAPVLSWGQLQSSGAISIDDIRTELGSGSGSLGALRTAAGLPAGAISIGDFYGYQDLPPCASVTFSVSTKAIPSTGGSTTTIYITTTGPWTLTDNMAWASTNPSSGVGNGNFTVSAGPGSGRSGTVTVTCGAFSDTVQITQ